MRSLVLHFVGLGLALSACHNWSHFDAQPGVLRADAEPWHLIFATTWDAPPRGDAGTDFEAHRTKMQCYLDEMLLQSALRAGYTASWVSGRDQLRPREGEVALHVRVTDYQPGTKPVLYVTRGSDIVTAVELEAFEDDGPVALGTRSFVHEEKMLRGVGGVYRVAVRAVDAVTSALVGPGVARAEPTPPPSEPLFTTSAAPIDRAAPAGRARVVFLNPSKWDHATVLRVTDDDGQPLVALWGRTAVVLDVPPGRRSWTAGRVTIQHQGPGADPVHIDAEMVADRTYYVLLRPIYGGRTDVIALHPGMEEHWPRLDEWLSEVETVAFDAAEASRVLAPWRDYYRALVRRARARRAVIDAVLRGRETVRPEYGQP